MQFLPFFPPGWFPRGYFPAVEESEAMALIRKVIRDAAVAALAAGGTDAGSRIYAGRVLPIGLGTAAPLPAILVKTERDDWTPAKGGTPYGLWDTALDLVVEAYAKPAAGSPVLAVEDALDQICEQALDVLAGDATFKASIVGIVGVRTDIRFERAETPIGIAAMTLQLLAQQA